nr:uncharacterized protein LOC126517422 [Dermacentor andersoni]
MTRLSCVTQRRANGRPDMRQTHDGSVRGRTRVRRAVFFFFRVNRANSATSLWVPAALRRGAPAVCDDGKDIPVARGSNKAGMNSRVKLRFPADEGDWGAQVAWCLGSRPADLLVLSLRASIGFACFLHTTEGGYGALQSWLSSRGVKSAVGCIHQ